MGGSRRGRPCGWNVARRCRPHVRASPSIRSNTATLDAGKTLAVIAAAQPSNVLPYYSICKEDVRRLRQVAGCGDARALRTHPPLAFKFPAFHFGIFGGDWRARARALSYIAPRYARLLWHTVSDVLRSNGKLEEGEKLGEGEARWRNGGKTRTIVEAGEETATWRGFSVL